jgi:hypothetical protein
MATRTGTQLKDTDAAAVESALDTLISTPSQANFDALLTALETVRVNGNDSRHSITTSDGRRDVGFGLAKAAKTLQSELRQALSKLPPHASTGKDFTGTASVWQKLENRHIPRGPWASYRNVSTTN